MLVYDLKSKSYGNVETPKRAKVYLKFLKNPHFLFYLYFFEDIVEQLKPMSVIFQSDSLLVCQVPRKLDECCSLIDVLAVAHGDAMNRLMSNLTVNDNKEIVFKEVELIKPSGRAVENITHMPEAYNEHFTRKFDEIINEIQHYLHLRFQDFEEEPLRCMVRLFDFEVWRALFKGLDELQKFSFEEVKKLAEYYCLHNIFTAEEKSLATKHWPLFRERMSKLRKNSLVETFTDILCRQAEDIKGMIKLLEIMMTVSPSMAACERFFLYES